MSRRLHPALAWATFLLSACTTTSPKLQGGPAPAPAAEQLTGLTSPQTRSLRSMGGDDHLSDDSVMREAMFGGSNEIYFAATAYRFEQNIGLDLVVMNRSGEPIALERKQLMVYDAAGQALTPVPDFVGAAGIGLRALGQSEEPAFVYETPDDFANGPALSTESVSPTSKNSRSQSASQSSPRSRANTDWRAIEAGSDGSPAPSTLRVAAGEGRPWWAYWSAASAVRYPITAFVVLGDEQLMFQFDSPSQRQAR